MTSGPAFAERAADRGGPGPAARRAAAVARSPGSPLPGGLRADLQDRLGHDFRHVRIHADEAAAQAASAIGARAFTVGPHVAFGRGEFRPFQSEGRRLLAHELVHVMQQGREPGGAVRDPTSLAICPPGSTRERDASARAAAVVNGVPAGGAGLRDVAGRGSAAASVERMIQDPGRDQRLDAYLDEDGRLEVTPAGPLDTGRSAPAFQLQPADAGMASLVVPGRDGSRHHMRTSELPWRLRSAVQEAARGLVPARQAFRVPGRAELSVPGAGRFLSFEEYRAGYGASRDLLPLPRMLFDVIVARCGQPADLARPGTAPQQHLPGELSELAGRLPEHQGAGLAVPETEAES